MSISLETNLEGEGLTGRDWMCRKS